MAVTLTSIDEIVTDLRLDRVDFIKMDIEGSECESALSSPDQRQGGIGCEVLAAKLPVRRNASASGALSDDLAQVFGHLRVIGKKIEVP